MTMGFCAECVARRQEKGLSNCMVKWYTFKVLWL